MTPFAPAMAGQQMAAGGKSDRKIDCFQSLENLPVYDTVVFDTAGGGTPDQLDGEMRIVPASAPAEIEGFIRYNLEQLDVSAHTDYDWSRFMSQASSIPWDIAGAYGVTTLFGISNWEWGSSSFHFESEGWFGENTKYLGVDKLGHAYTGYILTEYFTQRIAHSTEDRAGAAVTGALLGAGVQAYVEFFDGFAGEHGFSYEDFTMDAIGAGLSVLRGYNPGLAEKVDFRFEYVPSGNDGVFSPATDYTGQKYFLALKLSGFEQFENTPLRFLELDAGYYARGFSDREQERGENIRREPFFAIGLNLQELLGIDAANNTTPIIFARRALQYIQVPYTYAATSQN